MWVVEKFRQEMSMSTDLGTFRPRIGQRFRLVSTSFVMLTFFHLEITVSEKSIQATLSNIWIILQGFCEKPKGLLCERLQFSVRPDG